MASESPSGFLRAAAQSRAQAVRAQQFGAHPLRGEVSRGDGTRAAPMSREQRRAAIIAATLPLLREHGYSVTTRQIAEASGVGEGTIFRVFADKAELIDACLDATFDPTPTLELYAAIDRRLPLEQRLVAAVQILQDRMLSVVALLVALGFPRPPEGSERHRMDPRARLGHSRLLDALTELLEPDRERLRLSAAEIARIARLLTFAASHPKITESEPMTAQEIVSVLLYGVLASDPAGPGGTGEQPC